MRSVDAAYSKQLARLDFKAAWDFRLVDQDGKVYPLPPKAILNRSRSGEIDGGTWRLSLSIAADRLPSGVDPQQYHQIQADRLVAGTAYPYFRGVIDKAERGWSKDGGAVVESLEVEAFGVLQKAKGYRFDALRFDPSVKAGTYKLLGLCPQTRVPVSTALGINDTEQIPGALVAHDLAGYGLQIFTDSTLATTYTKDSDYTIDKGTHPATITWKVAPKTTRIFQFQKVERLVVPLVYDYVGAANLPEFFMVPYGRDYNDLFHTYVTSFTTSGSLTITVADPTGWYGLLSALDPEYLAVTTSDGVTHFRKVNGVTAGGVITIEGDDASPTNPVAQVAGLAVGDPIRLCTTEHVPAWDDDTLIQFYMDSAKASEYNRNMFDVRANLGQAIPLQGYNFVSGEEIWADVAAIRQDTDFNRPEYQIEELLVNGSGLFGASEVEWEPTGAWLKNKSWPGVTLDAVIAEFKEQTLPPNAFVHDTPEGTITIKPYRQATSPDWTLRGVTSITEAEAPEPVTAVTVLATGETANQAAAWFKSPSNFTDASRIVDNDHSRAASLTTSSNPAYATFRVPRPTPSQAYPHIDSIKVTGAGLLTVYLTRSNGSVYYLTGWTFKPLASGAAEISGDELIKILGYVAVDDWVDLTFRFDSIMTSGAVTTNATCSEIEILQRHHGAWRAMLTDDTALTDADQGADQFGTVWKQPDAAKRESYRYAPTSYLKRVSVDYTGTGNFQPRHEVITLSGISQQDTRDYSERYQDEHLRAGKTYRITAPLDDRAELGDTFRAFTPDGEALDLLLWGLADQGAPGDTMAEYVGVDYSL